MNTFWSRGSDFSSIDKIAHRKTALFLQEGVRMGDCILKERILLFLQRRFHLHHLNTRRGNFSEHVSIHSTIPFVIAPLDLPYTASYDSSIPAHCMNKHKIIILYGQRQ